MHQDDSFIFVTGPRNRNRQREAFRPEQPKSTDSHSGTVGPLEKLEVFSKIEESRDKHAQVVEQPQANPELKNEENISCQQINKTPPSISPKQPTYAYTGLVAYGPTRKLEILHKCEDFVVINKPFDVRINSNYPGDVTVQAMLHNNGFTADRPDKLMNEYYFVHRLDYATSGQLCVALTKRGSQAASLAFVNRVVEKKYVALVRGHIDLDVVRTLRGVQLDGDRLTIDVPIARDSEKLEFRYMVATFDDSERFIQKKKATTELVITRKGEYEGRPATEVLLTLHTGRTHQLRVHLKYIGHIIVGDFTYSDKTDNSPIRMMLHNTLLKFDCGLSSINCASRALFLDDDLWKPYEIGSF